MTTLPRKPRCVHCDGEKYPVGTGKEEHWECCSTACQNKLDAAREAETTASWEYARRFFIQSQFQALAAVLARLPDHTLWCVGSMEDGPFARLVLPNPDGTYSGGYRGAYGETPAEAVEAAWLGKPTLESVSDDVWDAFCAKRDAEYARDERRHMGACKPPCCGVDGPLPPPPSEGVE